MVWWWRRRFIMHLRNAGGFQPVLEQHPWQGAGTGRAGCRGASDHESSGKEHDVFDEEHCAGQGKVRIAGKGRMAADAFYPVEAEGSEKDGICFKNL